jgi:L-fuculose-phosphate aldolase
MVILRDERELVARYAKRLRPDGLAVLTAGNISARAGELMAITPTRLDYDLVTPELVCVVDVSGTAVDGTLPPSTEVPMHLAAYDASQAGAVVHTHSPYATALSTLVDELPPVHYLLAELGGVVRVAPYATFGTERLASHVSRALEGRNAVLLANHGALTVGESVTEAYERAVLLEWLSALYYRARLSGEPRLLPDGELELVAARLP